MDRFYFEDIGLVLHAARNGNGGLAPRFLARTTERIDCTDRAFVAGGPGTEAPPGTAIAPASRSCTWLRNAAFVTSFAGFGRRAARSACHCAVARYSKPPLRDWTHERIRREAAAVGDDATVLLDLILRSRPHPEQGFRSCIGIPANCAGLVQHHGAERVDAACARALALGTRSYTSVAAILKNRRDQPARANRTGCDFAASEVPSLVHENIRGRGYYH